MQDTSEPEINREVLRQKHKTTDLEEVVALLLKRLSPVMRAAPQIVAGEISIAGHSPDTELGKQLRSASTRISSLTRKAQAALDLLEIS